MTDADTIVVSEQEAAQMRKLYRGLGPEKSAPAVEIPHPETGIPEGTILLSQADADHIADLQRIPRIPKRFTMPAGWSLTPKLADKLATMNREQRRKWAKRKENRLGRS